MPFILLLRVCIVFFNVAKSPVMFATEDQSRPSVLFIKLPTRAHAYKHKNNVKTERKVLEYNKT